MIWLPTGLIFLIVGIYNSIQADSAALIWQFPLAVFFGWFMWTFVEYMIHRFIFHYHPKTERMKRFFFTFHGVHHKQPMCKTRLVMPPILSVPISFLFYGLFRLLMITILQQPLLFAPSFAGFTFGYLVYDLIHYSLHHLKSKKGYLAMCRRQHMRHHVTCPFMRFGVSVPIWDYVFGTMPASGFTRKDSKNKQKNTA